MRVRLREVRPEGEGAFYARTYPAGYKHDAWPDHVERVKASADLIVRYRSTIKTAADLSCGDCALLRGVDDQIGLEQAYVGDLIGARGDYPLRPHVRIVPPGPLPGSLDGLRTFPVNVLPVDLFILSETIEHVDDPDDLLKKIALHARYLFLSTPVSETADVGNAEHYWGWSQVDVRDMLQDTGWTPLELSILVPESTRHLGPLAYAFQLWMAVRA